MLDYAALSALAAVIEEGSFERAALALHVTPSAVSQRIRLLEERSGSPLVVVTRGGDGAYASLRGEAVAVTSPQFTVVDTVGAGDTFTAGLLHWLHEIDVLGGRLTSHPVADLADAMTVATDVAAVVCQRAGANPPWAHELAELPVRRLPEFRTSARG